MDFKQWEGFDRAGEWTKEIDVRGFIQANYTPYDGDESFLVGPTEKSTKLWNKIQALYEEEMAKYRVEIPELEEADDEDIFDFIVNGGDADGTKE